MGKHGMSILLLLTTALSSVVASASESCTHTTVQAVELDTPLPLGFTAKQLLAQIQGWYDTRVQWADGSREQAQLGIEYRGGLVRYVEQYFDDGGSGREIDYPCPNQLEMDVVMELRLVDTSRAEQFATTIRAVSPEEFTQYLAMGARRGAASVLIADSDRERLMAGHAQLVLSSELHGGELRGELAIVADYSGVARSPNTSVQRIRRRLAHWVVYGIGRGTAPQS